MVSVDQQILNTADVISRNIASSAGDRALLAQNILSQARNLVEGMIVRHDEGVGTATFAYAKVGPASDTVSANGKVNFLTKFHKLLQISTSHYTLDGTSSERLMLKYYATLIQIRELARDEFGLAILANLEDFPLDLDQTLVEYYEKIAARVDASRPLPPDSANRARYYVHSIKPFVVQSRVYYEVTFYEATNKVSKFDRIIGFTHLDITDKYAANLTLHAESIEVLGQTMPITVIKDWEVSIRPCEFDNFARFFGQSIRINSGSSEYRALMEHLTTTKTNLLDVVDMSDSRYAALKADSTRKSRTPRIFPMLDAARGIIRPQLSGHLVLRYLMLRMFNQLIKLQYNSGQSGLMSGLRLANGCNPFNTMPFCTSLIRHNPRIADLVLSIDVTGREHELLARRVKTNVEDRSMIYTPVAELEVFGDVDNLIAEHNRRIWSGHRASRSLVKDRGHVFIQQYEDGTATILEKLRDLATSGIAGYRAAVQQWLAQVAPAPDDQVKVDALERLFEHSQVALIYGAAGTGKSTMVDLISRYFHDKSILFLAHTNPAVDNLKRKVNRPGAPFRTISSQIWRDDSTNYDILVIDECSTVSNADMVKLLAGTSYKLLVLVGDVFQIESIQFGNWFGLARSFVPPSSVFELTTPFRTKNADLLDLWTTVRELKQDITETLARNTYSMDLDESLFVPQAQDEIILALNYDGLYGINNINRFLQSSNPEPGVVWGVNTYKVNDPVLFNESDRFRPVIYNNLKGRIVAIEKFTDRIQFDVSLDRPVTAFDVDGADLQYVSDSTVRFSVFERLSGDDDDESSDRAVPFQVAYAVAIHKAQGLEYDSVKVVITDANEKDITHSIFYTAITRARDKLRVYWSAETQEAVLDSLRRNANNNKDVSLLKARKSTLS